ncbi:MAG: hypothetical protein AB7O62_17810 [Pirellulales bacterium]
MNSFTASTDISCEVFRRSDGTLVVRVPSQDRGKETLPAAVFSFHAGDPQFDRWEQRLREQENHGP